MDPSAFFSAFGLVFVAELGDKTQLAAMALAARLPWRKVFVGCALAFVVLNVLAVAVGQALFELVPLLWIRLAAAALFAVFGFATLRGGGEDGAEEARADRGGPVLTAFSLIALAELGDKTQLATASLAAQQPSPLGVFAGSTLALWAVSLLGILVGARLARVVPLRVIRRVAGVLFLVFAAAMVVAALGQA